MSTDKPQYPRILLATIFIMVSLEFLQAGMIAFAAGPIMGQIGASPEEFSLITAVYACIAIATISKQYWLVERLGWRKFLQASVAVFVVGAAIAGSAASPLQFLLGRAVMALGGASFMTGGRMMINLIKPGPERFTGIKTFASGLAIANAAAPWLASVAVMHDHWNAIFGILIILSLLACALGSICLPTDTVPAEQRTQSQPYFLMWMMGGSFLLLYALQRAYYEFYTNIYTLLAIAAFAIASLMYFARSQTRHERPLLQVKELMQQRYLVVLALFTICYFVLGATNYMLPVLMQRALGFSWDVIGKVEALGLISALAGFWIIATILPKYPGPKKFYVIGFGALFICGWILSGINGNANLLRNILPAIACYGLFIIFTMSTNALQGFKDLQHNDVAFSHGQQVKNMLSQFGIGFGVSLATVSSQWRTAAHYAVLHERFVSGGAEFTHSIQQLSDYFSVTQGPQQAAQLATSQLAQQLGQQATLLAGLDYFWLLMLAGVVFAGVMGLQRILK